MEKTVVLILMTTCLIAYEAKSVNGNLTLHDYQNVKCPNNTIKCPPSADCCLKDSQVCINGSDRCEDVFKPNEDEHDTCCTALRKNDTTREGLIEVCKYRLGSLTWQQNCSKDASGFHTFEGYLNEKCPHDTIIVLAPGEDEHDKCCTALRTNDPRECLIEVCKYRLGSLTWQQNCSKAKYPEEPKGDSPSTVEETKPPPTVVPTEQQKEKVTPSSEASSDWELGVGLGVGLGVPLILCVVALILCVVFADKLLLFKNKLLKKGNTASSPLGQQEDKDFINPKSGSEPREDVTEDTSLENNASHRLAQVRLAQNSKSVGAAAAELADVTINRVGLHDDGTTEDRPESESLLSSG